MTSLDGWETEELGRKHEQVMMDHRETSVLFCKRIQDTRPLDKSGNVLGLHDRSSILELGLNQADFAARLESSKLEEHITLENIPNPYPA